MLSGWRHEPFRRRPRGSAGSLASVAEQPAGGLWPASAGLVDRGDRASPRRPTTGIILAVDAAIEHFFAGRREARRIFGAVDRAVRAAGPATVRVTRSQIAFRRKRGFAWAWTPDRWLEGRTAPLVLSIALCRRDRSRRWKEVVRPAPGRWMHHLELRSPREVDEPVLAWLREAWELAG
jgi:hypothetical protein